MSFEVFMKLTHFSGYEETSHFWTSAQFASVGEHVLLESESGIMKFCRKYKNTTAAVQYI